MCTTVLYLLTSAALNLDAHTITTVHVQCTKNLGIAVKSTRLIYILSALECYFNIHSGSRTVVIEVLQQCSIIVDEWDSSSGE